MIGHVMIDLQGMRLTPEEREILQHPQVGGVILFTRNYECKEQLHELIHSLRQQCESLLIAVDHEGGRVQRFRSEFTLLPPLATFGKLYDHDKKNALHQAELSGHLMARELLETGIDMSFAPVLDIDNESRVIGDRSFHRDPSVVALLGSAYVRGMHKAGMKATGKHFPGHGSVIPDSHQELPVDSRPFSVIEDHDLIPFKKLSSELDAMMTAHVIYTALDKNPATFSPLWLCEVLRKQLKFEGVIFSDDLGMAAADVMGDFEERANLALEAGCDMVLVCNHSNAAVEVLTSLERYRDSASQERLLRLRTH